LAGGCQPSANLTSPDFDSTSRIIFVGDDTGRLSAVSTDGLVITSVDVSNGSGRPLIDAPIVDSSTEKVFAFTGCTGSSDDCGSDVTNAQVVQVGVFLEPTTVVRANIGLSSASDVIWDGDFDNNYYTGSYATGHLYTCGNPDGNFGRILYRIGFSAGGVMNTSATTGPTLTSDTLNNCSPLTEIYNGTVDRLFLSVPDSGTLGGACTGICSSGECLYSFDITSSFPTTCSARTTESGGTSGISIDNISTSGPPTGSQLYFTPLSNGTPCTGSNGCAVQVSQSGLD